MLTTYIYAIVVFLIVILVLVALLLFVKAKLVPSGNITIDVNIRSNTNVRFISVCFLILNTYVHFAFAISVQRSDFFPKVVSVTYGKYLDTRKS